jgi:LuxR family maltose regulon positive regulatory protein
MDRSFLLQTKFLIPRHRGELLPRPHLLERLDSAVDNRLTLVSAPPGYGKTTLLAQLAISTERSCAWYQLDAADGDPTIFLSYLIAVLRNIQADEVPDESPPIGSAAVSLLEGSESAAAVSPERVLTVLINELAAASVAREWLIIMEDYHLVTNPDIHNLVHFLLENGPPGLHLVISSRTDPPLALARLRARGMLAEFRAPDLRFDDQEVANWLDYAIPGISGESARLLSEKTEGWAAALQIILSTLAGKDAGSAGRFIAELSGTQRFIFQYLAQEVFQQQSADRQRFLTHTAVLDQMNAGACDAILNTSDSQNMLDGLEGDNLFLVSLDERREWYRYHHLFREFLLDKLGHETPGQLARLERTTGQYYEASGELELAFTHYVRAGELPASAEVLTQFAAEYVERRRVAILQRYLGDLPDEVVRRYPELLLQHGNVLWRMGRVGAAVSRYEDALAAFAEQSDNVGQCYVLTQMAELARSQGNYRRSRALAAQALSHASDVDHAGRANALMILAKSEGFLTGMDRGRQLAEESVAAARRAGDTISPRARANLLRSLGHICWWHGDPQAALHYCQEALESVVDERSPIAASIYITMATPYVYRPDLDKAQAYAELGLEIAQQLQLSSLLPRAHMTLGGLLTRRGEWQQAERHLRQAVQLSQGSGLDTYFRIMATSYLSQNLCGQGRIEEARQLAEAVLWERAASPDTYEMVVCRSVLADVALEEDQLDEARAIFESLIEIGRRRQFRVPLAMVYFGLAYVHLRQDNAAKAIDYARQSVAILEPLGTWQLYLDQGERARLVCQALAEADQATPFVNQVLSRLPISPALAVESQDALIRVQCLGPFRVFAGDEEITQADWVSTKARDLLAYFVTFRSQRLPLERVVASIWPEGDQSDRAFHSALYRLRRALRGADDRTKFVLLKGGECWLDAARFDIDVKEFEASLDAAQATTGEKSAAHYERAIRLYQGEFLDNLLYYDWATAERRRLLDLYLRALRAAAAHRSSCGDHREALRLIELALQEDALNEQSYREAMRYSACAGDKAGLVRRYRQLEQTLRDELNVMPSSNTQTLYGKLMDQVGLVGHRD